MPSGPMPTIVRTSNPPTRLSTGSTFQVREAESFRGELPEGLCLGGQLALGARDRRALDEQDAGRNGKDQGSDHDSEDGDGHAPAHSRSTEPVADAPHGV